MTLTLQRPSSTVAPLGFWKTWTTQRIPESTIPESMGPKRQPQRQPQWQRMLLGSAAAMPGARTNENLDNNFGNSALAQNQIFKGTKSDNQSAAWPICVFHQQYEKRNACSCMFKQKHVSAAMRLSAVVHMSLEMSLRISAAMCPCVFQQLSAPAFFSSRPSLHFSGVVLPGGPCVFQQVPAFFSSCPKTGSVNWHLLLAEASLVVVALVSSQPPGGPQITACGWMDGWMDGRMGWRWWWWWWWWWWWCS